MCGRRRRFLLVLFASLHHFIIGIWTHTAFHLSSVFVCSKSILLILPMPTICYRTTCYLYVEKSLTPELEIPSQIYHHPPYAGMHPRSSGSSSSTIAPNEFSTFIRFRVQVNILMLCYCFCLLRGNNEICALNVHARGRRCYVFVCMRIRNVNTMA